MKMDDGVLEWFRAEIPGMERLRVLTTTRTGGTSPAPFDSLNLADHVGDDPRCVRENRHRLVAGIGGLPIQWLAQVHGIEILEANADTVSRVPEADGAWTGASGLALAVLTADCLPIVIGGVSGSTFAVVHGGWRGLVNGVIPAALKALPEPGHAAWIGPGIGPGAYEVGAEVLQAVAELGGDAASAILPAGDSVGAEASAGARVKGRLDLFTLAASQLHAAGIHRVTCERRCTYETPSLYSYRRDGVTGRMATIAWLA